MYRKFNLLPLKKQLLITALLFIIAGEISGQSPVYYDCPESQASEYVENSAMKVLLRNAGDMFFDRAAMQGRYVTPYSYGQPEASSLFAAGTWMGAYDSGNNLKMSAQTYRSQGNDYWAGPLDASGLITRATSINFDQIWEVKRPSIELHIADYNADGVINNPIHPTILRWPGKGNPQFAAQMGFQLPNQDLAPFYDRNNNGIYEPTLGDYPVYEHGNPTAIAAEILWSVFNDNGNVHTNSHGNPLQVEVHQTAYVFDCANDPILTNTLFIKHKVINKGTNNLYDYHYGVWADPNLGCYDDDFIGSIPSKNTVYTYNADNNDSIVCDTNGVVGYGMNPPVQALTILNQSMDVASYTIPYQHSSNPPGPIWRYRKLATGAFRNGVPLTAGGDGYDPTGTNPLTSYVFPNHPNDPNGWSMAAEGIAPFDMQWVVSTQKDSFVMGEIFEIDLAYSFHRNLDSTNLGNVSVMYAGVDHIQQLYANNFSTINCNAPSYCTTNCIHPGDANDNGIANDFDILVMGLHQGDNLSPRPLITDSWAPQEPPMPLANGYADANGDGLIDVRDLDVNTANLNKLHSNYTGIQEGENNVGVDLRFERFYLYPFFVDTLLKGPAAFALDILLGDASFPMDDILGVTFRLDYDSELFTYDAETTWNTLGAGWLEDDGATVYTRLREEPNRLHYVATRLNQTGYTGYGSLGRLAFYVPFGTQITPDDLVSQICFSDFQAIRADGTHISLGASCEEIRFDTSAINVSITKIQQEPLDIKAYPNPAQTIINIDLGNLEEASIKLYSLLGESLYSSNNQQGLVTIERNKLPSGIYLLVVKAADGRLTTRKILFE